MTFIPIDRGNWERKEYFDHYFSQVPCTYSAVFPLDITLLRQRGEKLYPAMLYAITTIVNRHREFRTAINPQGQLGFYQQMHPCYTVFHKDDETFSNIWTSYAPEYRDFLANYQLDQQRYGSCKGMMGKPEPPENTFPVSMIPWASFTGFNLNLQKGYDYLLSIFTMGKFYQEKDKTLLPLAVQVHHGVCDGFHLCRFVEELQTLLKETFPFPQH